MVMDESYFGPGQIWWDLTWLDPYAELRIEGMVGGTIR